VCVIRWIFDLEMVLRMGEIFVLGSPAGRDLTLSLGSYARGNAPSIHRTMSHSFTYEITFIYSNYSLRWSQNSE
jgi:hypothetical protein